MRFDKKIVLENGLEFRGKAFGARCDGIAELVLNTAMVGYQEIVSDPSYASQIVLMTYPLIGNYGITDDDFESKQITVGGLVVREYNDIPSNFRYTKTLSELLEENGIPGISEVDTRYITRVLRDNGPMKAMLVSESFPVQDALEAMRYHQEPVNLMERVSCKKKWYHRTFNQKYNIVVLDCGVKHSMLHALNQRGCNLTIVPYNTDREEILSLKPDGLFIGGGPGDPAVQIDIINTVKSLIGEIPMFGVGLGFQIIALAFGASTYKMKNGHRGTNHPIRDLATGYIDMANQSHGYAVDKLSLEKTDFSISHINVLDGTVEGAECRDKAVFGMQFLPPVDLGPFKQISGYDKFINMINNGGKCDA